MGKAAKKLCYGMAGCYSFFGVTLALAPKFFWGPESPLCYWTEWDNTGVWFARALGVWMTGITTSPWTCDISCEKLAKAYLPLNFIFMGMFLQASFLLDTTGPGENAWLPFKMFYTQLPVAATFLGLNIMAVMEDDKEKSK